jgi:hypothetical protein
MCFTTELGEPCDPRNALRALKTAAKRAGLPSSISLHTLRHCAAPVDAVRWRAAQGGLGGVRSRGQSPETYTSTSGPEVSREALTRLSHSFREKRWSKKVVKGKDDLETRLLRRAQVSGPAGVRSTEPGLGDPDQPTTKGSKIAMSEITELASAQLTAPSHHHRAGPSRRNTGRGHHSMAPC